MIHDEVSDEPELHGDGCLQRASSFDERDVPERLHHIRKRQFVERDAKDGHLAGKETDDDAQQEIEQVPQHIGHEQRLHPSHQFLEPDVKSELTRLEEEVARDEVEEGDGDGGNAL